jgi:predicted kinase
MHPARLVIVCGPPGAGTTQRAELLAERFAATRMEPEGWMERLGFGLGDVGARRRIERIQSDLTIDLLRLGANVVAASGTRQRTERDHLRGRAIGVGALVHLEFVDAPIGVAWSETIECPTPDELATYDPMPPVSAADRPGSASFPYGSWLPQSRPR